MPSEMPFLERMLLRDYAMIERLQRKQSHGTTLSLAALATSAWVFLVLMTIANVASLLLRDVIPTYLNPPSAPMLVAVTEIGVVMIIVSAYVDRIARSYRLERSSQIDRFKKPSETLVWWLVTLSIIPIVGLNALILMAFFDRL